MGKSSGGLFGGVDLDDPTQEAGRMTYAGFVAQEGDSLGDGVEAVIADELTAAADAPGCAEFGGEVALVVAQGSRGRAPVGGGGVVVWWWCVWWFWIEQRKLRGLDVDDIRWEVGTCGSGQSGTSSGL